MGGAPNFISEGLVEPTTLKVSDLPKNVTQLIDKPKVDKREAEPWNIIEIATFLEIAKTHRLYCAFYLAITDRAKTR